METIVIVIGILVVAEVFRGIINFFAGEVLTALFPRLAKKVQYIQDVVWDFCFVQHRTATIIIMVVLAIYKVISLSCDGAVVVAML